MRRHDTPYDRQQMDETLHDTNHIRQRQTHLAVAFQCLSIVILFISGGILLLYHHHHPVPHTNEHTDRFDHTNHMTTTIIERRMIRMTLLPLHYSNYSSSCCVNDPIVSIILMLFQQLLGGILISYAMGMGVVLLLPILYDIRVQNRQRNSSRSNTITTTTPNSSSNTESLLFVQNIASYCHYGSTISTMILALSVIIFTMVVDSKLTSYNNNNNNHPNHHKHNEYDNSTNHTTIDNITNILLRYTIVEDDDDDERMHSQTDYLSNICLLLFIMGMTVLLLSSTSVMITFWPITTTTTTTQITPLTVRSSAARNTRTATTIHSVGTNHVTASDDADNAALLSLVDPLQTPLLMECVDNESGCDDTELDTPSNIENGTVALSSTSIFETATTVNIITPPTTKVSATRRLLQLASSQIVYLYMGCIVLLIRLPFSLAIPHFVSTTLAAVASSQFASAHQEIQLLFIAGTIDAILDFWAFFLFGYANQRIVRKLRIDLFTRLLSQEVAFFDIHSSGELSSRLNSDCSEMAGDLTWFFRFSIESVVRITGITIYMMVRCPILGTCAISIIPAVAIINKSYGDWLHHNSKKVQDALADANIVAQEALSNIRTVISFVTESQECERYENRIEQQYQLNIQQLFMTALYYMVVSTFLINTMVQGALLWVGSILIERDELTPGILLAFMLYQSQLQNEVLSLMNSYTSLIKSSGAGDKVFALIDRQPPQPSTAYRYSEFHPTAAVGSTTVEPNDSSNETEASLNHNLDERHADHHFSFENVNFAYPSRPDNVILNGLNLTIPRGQTVALVGTSGGGKTTIMNLLQRFYDPCSGQLLYYGDDLRTVDVMAHRKEIGIVTQDPILFQGTIRDNITYGCLVPDQVRDEHVIDAAQLAHAHSFIQSFPDGYDTMIGERGVQLSGGQKQRIGTKSGIFQFWQ